MNYEELRNNWIKIYNTYVERELADDESPFTEEQLTDVDVQDGVIDDIFLPYYQEGGTIEPDDEDMYNEIEQYWLMNTGGEESPEEIKEDWYQDVLFIEKFGRR